MKSYLVPKKQRIDSHVALHVPSSKSLANRSLILAALSEGDFHLTGDFQAEDIQLMISALQKLGVRITSTKAGVQIHNDLSWKESTEELELYLGNSGTCVRFLSSLVAHRKGRTILMGKDRMRERPLSDLVDALQLLGVDVEYLENEGYPPLRVHACENPSGKTKIRGEVSSQYLTSLLLSASAYPQGMEIQIAGELISRPYVQMTIELMKSWGIPVEASEDTFWVPSTQLVGRDVEIEGDASAAVYWWALAYLHQIDVEILNIPKTSVQGDVQFLTLMQQMDELLRQETLEFNMNDMPDASLMLIALAPLLSKPVKITDIASLRVKETDRIEAMATELRKLGVDVETGPDWVAVEPLDLKQYDQSKPIDIATYDDHRVAMSMAIIGTVLGNLNILDPDCVAKSYPAFWKDLERF